MMTFEQWFADPHVIITDHSNPKEICKKAWNAALEHDERTIIQEYIEAVEAQRDKLIHTNKILMESLEKIKGLFNTFNPLPRIERIVYQALESIKEE